MKAMRKESPRRSKGGFSNNPPSSDVTKVASQDGGAICGDGMCPFNPCAKFPKCIHADVFKKKLAEASLKECEDCGSKDYPYHDEGCTEGEAGWVRVKDTKEKASQDSKKKPVSINEEPEWMKNMPPVCSKCNKKMMNKDDWMAIKSDEIWAIREQERKKICEMLKELKLTEHESCPACKNNEQSHGYYLAEKSAIQRIIGELENVQA